MGYQLYSVMLCGVVVELAAVGVRPNAQSPAVPTVDNARVSAASSGGLPQVHVVHTPLEFKWVQIGAVPLLALKLASEASVLLVPRSAGSCSSRIALGLIGLGVPVAGSPAPLAVGAVTPRANPSDSHSLVTGTHVPELLRYSTRNQPSIRLQESEKAELYGVSVLLTTGRAGLGRA